MCADAHSQCCACTCHLHQLCVVTALTWGVAGTLLAPQLHPSSGDLPTGQHWRQAERRAAIGVLFQFPERHFLGTTTLEVAPSPPPPLTPSPLLPSRRIL